MKAHITDEFAHGSNKLRRLTISKWGVQPHWRRGGEKGNAELECTIHNEAGWLELRAQETAPPDDPKRGKYVVKRAWLTLDQNEATTLRDWLNAHLPKGNRHFDGTETEFLMPAGRYWIGDLCYIQDDEMREAALELILTGAKEPGGIRNGKFEVNGVTFGEFSTQWGDGGYPYENENGGDAVVIQGTSYVGVDSGTIGIIPIEYVKGDTHLGLVVEFPTEFICRRDCDRKRGTGDLHFGSIVIHTGDQDNDGDDDA